jgi:hypothetical protein
MSRLCGSGFFRDLGRSRLGKTCVVEPIRRPRQLESEQIYVTLLKISRLTQKARLNVKWRGAIRFSRYENDLKDGSYVDLE